MMKDAESHAEEDRKARELADVKNTAENLVYSTEKSLRDMGDKVDASTRAEIEAAAAEVKSALEGDDQEAIQAKTDTLMQASHKLAEAVYQQAQQQQQRRAATAPPRPPRTRTSRRPTTRSSTTRKASEGDSALEATWAAGRAGRPPDKTGGVYQWRSSDGTRSVR